MKQLFLLALLLWPVSSRACVGAFSHQETFFSSLPSALEEEPVVARVRVLENTLNVRPKRKKASGDVDAPVILAKVVFSSGIIIVEVVANISGSAVGDIFKVKVPLSSCSRGNNVKVGSQWYIAGVLDGNVFRGTWVGRKRYWNP